ncbi:MAG: TIGR02466 family protein [Hyphomicrobiaceae bacterium]
MSTLTSTTIAELFVTRLYRARLKSRGLKDFNARLLSVVDVLASDDGAGLAWSHENDYPGYTSYASLNDLAWRFPEFRSLQTLLDQHVAAFAEALDLDLKDRPLVCDSLWVNVLDPGGHHGAHIHPNAVISGTYYVSVPGGAGSIRFEDPRLSQFMAAPPRRKSGAPGNQPFATLAPREGDVLLWESWLRHEVLINKADAPRVSVSFNYASSALPPARDELGDEA